MWLRSKNKMLNLARAETILLGKQEIRVRLHSGEEVVFVYDTPDEAERVFDGLVAFIDKGEGR